MMSALPVLIVVWAVLTGLFLALLAYNATITRYEENQLFLDDASANAIEQQQQTSILRKVHILLPVLRTLGVLSAILTVLIIVIYTWDCWQKLQIQ
jgi:cytochrome b